MTVRPIERCERVGRTAVRAAAPAVLAAFVTAAAIADDGKRCPEVTIRVPSSMEPPLAIERRDLVQAIHALAELMREDRVRKDNEKDESVIVTTNLLGHCRPDGAAWSLTVVPPPSQ
jgi:hypothetical protein